MENVEISIIVPILYRIYQFIKKILKILSLFRKYKQPYGVPIIPYVTALIRLTKAYMKHRLKLK